MSKPGETSGLFEFAAALRAHGGGARSPLFRWMYQNHDELAGIFAEARPNWRRVTVELTGRGFTGPNGGPLRPETVRKLWLRVRRRHEKARPGKPDSVTSAPVVMEIEPPASPEPAIRAADMLADLKRQMDKRSGRA